ncbi:hypothetical protein [Granulicella arctica]|uniref:hypothetical protein n=1 Tax=Granulicella arctica TaxID=940613 RepID=UPI0021E00ED9|nr:hypothetical protein [Granulicella arctica]
MNRRHFLASTALTAAHLALAQSSATHITIHPEPQQLIPPDFLGLGYEISSLTRPGLLSRSNTVYTNLVRTLNPQGVIRIGGNTADYASYAPNAAAVSTSYASVVNDQVLRDLGTFLEATDWNLIWALNLGRGTVEQAVAEARTVTTIAGKRLLAFEIGNEPDLFPNEKHRPTPYTYEQWLADYRRVKAALRNALPNIPFAGPDVAGHTDWVTRYVADEGHDSVLLTHHYYRGNQSPASTIAQLLGSDPKLQPQLDQLRDASRTSHLPYRICEVNSFSGGGRPGVSDTLASALWVLDYMYTLASNGCAGVNMETGVNQHDFISSYSPIGDDEHGQYTARPEYYGMLAFAQGASGHLLATTVDNLNPDLKIYAAQQSLNVTTLTLINKGPAAIPITVDAVHNHASTLALKGPAIDAKTDVTLGGTEVAADGTWKPAAKLFPIPNHTLKLTLPASSAIIVSFNALR